MPALRWHAHEMVLGFLPAFRCPRTSCRERPDLDDDHLRDGGSGSSQWTHDRACEYHQPDDGRLSACRRWMIRSVMPSIEASRRLVDSSHLSAFSAFAADERVRGNALSDVGPVRIALRFGSLP